MQRKCLNGKSVPREVGDESGRKCSTGGGDAAKNSLEEQHGATGGDGNAAVAGDGGVGGALPPDWERRQLGVREFWFNARTRTSSWVHPASTAAPPVHPALFNPPDSRPVSRAAAATAVGAVVAVAAGGGSGRDQKRRLDDMSMEELRALVRSQHKTKKELVTKEFGIIDLTADSDDGDDTSTTAPVLPAKRATAPGDLQSTVSKRTRNAPPAFVAGPGATHGKHA